MLEQRHRDVVVLDVVATAIQRQAGGARAAVEQDAVLPARVDDGNEAAVVRRVQRDRPVELELGRREGDAAGDARGGGIKVEVEQFVGAEGDPAIGL
jgi:hypothetical protein